MSEIEIVTRSLIYAGCALAVLAGCFWWGWDQRTKLALKLEHFRVTTRAWDAYDEYLKKEGKPPARAELHSIDERQSGR